MKIAVIGYSGAGKSTLAMRLADEFGIRAFHLDRAHFLPNWVERDPEETRQIVRAELAKPDWIIDGNYPSFDWEQRMLEADWILWLNFTRLTCLCHVIRRRWRYRGRVRESMANGCTEKLDWEFVWWILYAGRTETYRANYRSVAERYPQKVVVLRNDRETNRWFEQMRTMREEGLPDPDTQRGKDETLPSD